MNLAQTRVGSVLVSAAVIDDVVGLVMSRSVTILFVTYPIIENSCANSKYQ